VRSLLGLSLVGDSYTGRFVIADIKIDLDLPTERLAFFDPEWNPGNTVLMHRQPFGIWRIDFRLPEGEEPQEALRFEILKARIDAHLEMIGYEGKSWELDWCSVYSARALTLENYVHGHVVFAATRRTYCPSSACAVPTPDSRMRSTSPGNSPSRCTAGPAAPCSPPIPKNASVPPRRSSRRLDAARAS